MKKLDDYGCFEGRHPVALILESLHRTESPATQAKIANLIAEIDAICVKHQEADHESTFFEISPGKTSIIGQKYQLLKDDLIHKEHCWEIWKAYQIGGPVKRYIAIKLIHENIPKNVRILLTLTFCVEIYKPPVLRWL